MLLADLCAQFVNVAPNDLDSKIENAQRLICESLRVNHSSVWQFSEGNPDLLVLTHAYRDSKLRPLPSRPILKEYFPWGQSKLLNKEIICLPNTAKAPPDAATDMESWRQYGIRSTLAFPLSVGDGTVVGALAFDSAEERDWPDPLQRRLQTLAFVFSQALDRKLAEIARFRLAAIVESSEDAIISKNLDATITSWNAGALRVFGYTEEEAVGRPITILIPPDLWDEENRILEKLRAGERIEHYETIRVTKAGKNVGVSLSISPIRDSTGRIVGFSKIARDITERKRAEELVRASEERFRLAAQAGKMYSFEWDATTGAVVRSPEHVKVLGVAEPPHFTHQEFMGKIHPDDRPKFIATIGGLTPENPTGAVTYRVLISDGTLVWLRSSGRAFFDGEGRMLRVIGIAADVTDLKRAEEALLGVNRKLVKAQEQERARIGRELHDDISQRLAMLAIELDQLREKHHDLPSEVRGRMHELQQMTTDISSSVHAMSHDLHSSKLEYLGLVAGIKSWCKEFGERQRMEIDFKTNVAGVLPPEVGVSLLRVVQEAVHNAIKHSGVRRVEVQLREDSGEIHIIVSDSGKGFDIEAARQGQGLGLTSMQERVRLVGGTMAIESKPMGGTTIHVRVPLKFATPSGQETQHEPFWSHCGPRSAGHTPGRLWHLMAKELVDDLNPVIHSQFSVAAFHRFFPVRRN